MAENYLNVELISKSIGDKILFENISFGINKGQRIALVARNGTGKSSLLNCIVGKDQLDSGTISFRRDLQYAYLEQNPQFSKFSNVLEAVTSNGSDYMLDEDLLQKELRAKEILSRLNIKDINQSIDTLSGGQRKKVALCRTLLEPSDFLIFDEPTNHLDIAMIEWLEDYLTRGNKTLLIVTHDRYLINDLCTDVYELEKGALYSYHGNFDNFLRRRSEREEALRAQIDKAKNLYRKELDWVSRMPQARGGKSKSRLDAFEKIKQQASVRLDVSEKDLSVKMHRIGGKVLELQHADFSFGIRKILSDFTYTFKRGEKIGIVGANGIGKSTFLDIITGAQRLDGGKVIIGDTIKYGYYRQEGLTEKDDRRVIDIIKEGAEELSLSDGATLSASSFLTYFGFSTQTQYNYYGNLSGGERRKLYLLKTLIKNPNFLILDEPTNDLDIYNLITLEKFLKQYKGCLLIVSHDRSFLDGVVDHLFIFQDNGQIKDYYGTYQWQDYMKTQAQDELSNKKDNVLNKKRLSYNSREDKAKKLSFKEKKELEEINAMLPQLEKEKDLLTQQISSGALLVEELMQKSKRIQEVIEEIDQKETRWLELSSKDSD